MDICTPQNVTFKKYPVTYKPNIFQTKTYQFAMLSLHHANASFLKL